MAYYSRHTGEEIDSLLEQISEGVIVEVDSSLSSTSKNPVQNKVVTSALANKQEKLISGTTIKTINSIPILGAGNIVISGGGSNSGVSYEEVEQMLQGKQDSISDLADIREGASLGATAIQREDLASVATSGSYNDLKNKPTIPVAVTESTVSGWGFTKNTGTYTKPSGGIPKDDMASGVQASLNRADTALQSYTEIYRGTITGVKMNGVVKGTSGQVDLGTVITEHQDISGKQDVIADLDSIRKKANSAIQSIPDEYVTSDELESTISSKGFATESWVEGKGYLTEHQDISKKQDVILDLAAIRAGAAKGATALQEVPDTYVTDVELASSLGGKQDTLVSGVNLKTINGTSLLGGGNVVIAGEGGISYDDTELRYLISNKVDKVEGKELSTNDFTDEAKAKLDSLENYDDTSVISLIRNKQDKLVSGSNIRTINGTSILGGGDIEIEGDSYDDTAIKERISDVESSLEEKQDVISDLDVIRDGASKGATALQSVPSEYMTEVDVGAEMAKKADTDGVYPDMTVGRSANLLGVADGESAEFLFRPTDGDGSIKDGFASIEAIKGNSVVWNQLIPTPCAADKSNVANGVTFVDNRDGSYTVYTDENGATADAFIYIYDKRFPLGGHTVLMQGCPQGGSLSTYYFGDRYYGFVETGKGVITSATITELSAPAVIVAKGTVITTPITFNPRYLDLTQMFGAGNEPTTIEEFYARIPMGVDLNAYNEGEVINMCADSIKTVGFNAWDEEWETGFYNVDTGVATESLAYIRSKADKPIKVLPNSSYYIHNGTAIGKTDITYFSIIFFYDENDNYISRTASIANNTFTPPSNCAFMRLMCNENYGTTYNHDICINLVHTGYRNGEYEPYVSNEKALPIADYFPNGMNGIGDVKDELTPTEAIQRIGIVDLGNLDWELNNASASPYAMKSKSMIGAVGVPATNYTKANLTSTMPTYTRQEIVFAGENASEGQNDYAYGVGVGITGELYAAVKGITDAASFKAAMSGVMLYYELAEPIVTKIDTPLDLTYPAWDFGTEEIIADTPTTPFSGSIIYEFNARDTIRANKRAVNELREDVEANKIGLLGKQDTLISSTNIKTINGESILGEGNLTIESNNSSAVVAHAASETEVELTPNVIHKWDGATSLSLTVPEDPDGMVYSYKAVFVVASSVFSLSLPYNLRWVNSTMPAFEYGKQYEISIEGGRVLWAMFDEPAIEGEELPWIENDGTDYILTDYYPDENDVKQSVKFSVLETLTHHQCIVGTSENSTLPTTKIAIWALSNNGNIVQYFDAINTTLSYTVAVGQVYEFSRESIAATKLNASRPLTVFNLNSSSGVTSTNAAHARFYYFRLYDASGKVTLDLRPFKRTSDGAIGVLDAVSGTFYPSANGNLTEGA